MHKIIINNFGNINRFDFDFEKTLTVIYGKNNIGKSYATTFIYLLLKKAIEFHENLPFFFYEKNNSESYIEKIKGIQKKVIENPSKEYNLNKDFEKIVLDILNDTLALSLEDSIAGTFGSLESTVNNNNKENCTIEILVKKSKMIIEIEKKLLFKEIKLERALQGKVSLNKNNPRNGKNNKLFVYATENSDWFVQSFVKLIEKQIKEMINTLVENNNTLFFFPASRSGLYNGMNAFSQIIAELSKYSRFINKELKLPAMSEPVADYILKLAQIEESQKEKPLSSIKKEEIFKKIEKDILKGEVLFDKEEKVLKYRPINSEYDFSLKNVSSMVAELSPIVAFFKFILNQENEKNLFKHIFKRRIRKKYIIFIEEPEAHLHPEAQVKLAEIFNEMLDLDIKIVITSHSNYIFNKFNNLVLAGKINFNYYNPILIENTSSGSFSKRMEIDELGVSDENFMDVSEELFEEREEIIEALNEKADLELEISNDREKIDKPLNQECD